MSHLVLVGLLTAAVLPYVIGLGDSTIWDANEAFYAETPREMIESGDYINPSFNYYPRFNKPVLSYWAVAASYHMFGVSELSERLPIAFSAIVLIATAFGLGRAVGTYESALLAGIILATAPRFLMFSRRIIIDMWITMFMALTLLFFVLAEINAQRAPNPEPRPPNPEPQPPTSAPDGSSSCTWPPVLESSRRAPSPSCCRPWRFSFISRSSDDWVIFAGC